MKKLKLTERVYNQIVDTLGQYPPECGGVLGAGENGIITEYFFDSDGKSLANSYIPNIQAINKVLAEEWMPNGIFMVGIVHSHSNGVAVPSCGDISYGIRILQALDTVEEFYLPIVTIENEKIQLSCHGIFPDPERQFVCRKVEFEII